MEFIFITGNKDKFAEASQIIPDLIQKDLDLTEIQEIDSKKIIVAKLEEAKKQVQGNLIVEDVSFNMECISGFPGPLIKWFLKSLGNEGIYKIAKDANNFNLEVKVIIGLSFENGNTVFFEGVTIGTIVSPRGENGWGFDSITQPLGQVKTFAEMTDEEKNSISMRRIAFTKLKDYLGLL